ncbi:hypothetical protein [Taibaiella koreensis]|uniref:hypothetical protein n=1 Tax=Taibaiella koreensis TaxID=1268548 RepID=UPI000E59BE75|nr:hypothetical protein [Taibaiella koreensis]
MNKWTLPLLLSSKTLFFVVVMLVGCNTGSSTNVTAETTTSPAGVPQETVASSADPGNVSFKINGVAALTAIEKDDVAGGRINAMNDQFSLTLFGDNVKDTKRGMLSFTCPAFTKAAGVVKNARASYTRYLDAHGGKIVVYSSKEGTFSLELTKMEQLPDGPVGEEWLVSGTFSGTLPVVSYYVNEAKDKTLQFTEGRFDNLKVTVLGRKKNE